MRLSKWLFSILFLCIWGCAHHSSNETSQHNNAQNLIEVVCEPCSSLQMSQIQGVVNKQNQVQKVFILKDQQNWYASWTSTNNGFSISKIKYQSFEHLCQALLQDLSTPE